MTQVVEDHYFFVAQALAEGRLIPFLGAGINLADRPEGAAFEVGSCLPSGAELTDYLAKEFRYPIDEVKEIKRVSEYVSMATGRGPLYEKLRQVFDCNFPSSPVHRFLAELPGKLTALGYPNRYPLILTTNYDDVLERALSLAGQEYDVIVYVAEGDDKGKLRHIPFQGEPCIIETPNEYDQLPFESGREAKKATSPGLKRTVILKVHGAVDRDDPERDSYVITEDHYIDYLARSDIGNLLPASLLKKLKFSNLLFLGYSITDWNLRVLLNRVWYEQQLRYKAWAVQRTPSPLDVQFWQSKQVEVLDVSLDDYVMNLAREVDSLHR